jgi:uncharacterized protein YcbK (DUF882 family)
LRAKSTTLALALALTFAAPTAFAAGGGFDDDAPQKAKAHTKKKGKKHPIFSGYQVGETKLRNEPLPRPSGHLKLFAVNFNEGLEVHLYDENGEFAEGALDQLNHFWRCKRTGTEKPIDPHLFEILSLVYDHFEGRTIELVSGFRNQKRQTSFHFHGSAADIRIPGVSEKVLHAYVESLDVGGMGIGIYPRGGFIHVDVRPEPSYRWTDYSPPGTSDMGHPKGKKKKSPNS